MNCSKTMGLFGGALLVLVMLSGAASASFITGTNPILDSPGVDGNIFIPLQLATSGVLGDALGGGKFVGLDRDTLVLDRGSSATGYVEFMLIFNLSGEIPDGMSAEPGSVAILLAFGDLDFVPVVIGKNIEYHETLELGFMADANGPIPITPDLIIDESNYDTFPGPPDFPTNQEDVVYEIMLQSHLGVTDLEFENINSDHEFALYVWLRTEHYNNGSRKTLTNTSESINNSFSFVAAPEPGVLMLMLTGSVGMLIRKRR